MKHLAIILAFLMTLSSPLAAQDIAKGSAAWNSGDYATAIKEFRPLAEAGVAKVQNYLGFMYHEGQGVFQDYVEAVKWYRLASNQGFSAAQTHLGSMYRFGRGVDQDNVMAHMWYNISAVNGSKVAADGKNELAEILSSENISKAQAMARKCMSSGYTKCGY